jgi:WD40 repeat protein
MGNSVLGPLQIHTNAYAVTFSPNGRQIAAGLYDGTILLMDAVTGEVIVRPIKRHTGHVSSVNFSPDGRKLLSGSSDHTVQIWDAQTGINILGSLGPHNIYSAVFSGDGKRVVIASYDSVTIMDAKSGNLVWRASAGRGNAYFAAFSVDTRMVVSLSSSITVIVWNADTGARVDGHSSSTLQAEGSLAVGFISGIRCPYYALSPNGKWLLGLRDSRDKVCIWDLKTRQPAATFQSHTNNIYSVAFSPDSKRILSTSADNTIQVYTLAF